MRPVCWNSAISASLRPRMRSRLRAASSPLSAERRSFCAAVRSFCDCCHSLSATALPSYRSLFRRSTICARLSCERALFSAEIAAMKSFCACTMSVASMVNSGWPAATLSPGRAEQLGDASRIGREDRRRAVLVDRDLALGGALGVERPLLDRLDRQRRPFGVARTIEARVALLGLAGQLGIDQLDALRLARQPDDRAAGDEQQRRHRGGLLAPRQRRPRLMGPGQVFVQPRAPRVWDVSPRLPRPRRPVQ